jgi:ribosomal protein S17
MENGLISVVVETDKDKTFIIEVPSSIKHKELRKLLENEIAKTSHFYFVYKNKRYEEGIKEEEV